MQTYINRKLQQDLNQYLNIFPVVGVLGARQSGKSTLIKHISEKNKNFLYLDLQNPDDYNKLLEPMLFFEENQDKMICLDEIQLYPHLFSILRSVVDKNRKNGKFILLGSASQDIIQQTSESLAGRIGLLDLTPFTVDELSQLNNYDLKTNWLRGGFPISFLAVSNEASSIWLENYIKTYVERDIPQFGFQIPALQLRRFLTMLAHLQGQLLNQSKLADSMGKTHPTIKRYIDILEQTFIVRTIQPYEMNIKKRLIKSPKVYIRDSGILHNLLRINSFNDLLSNPIVGSSWEGFVIENILVKYKKWESFFYRTNSGVEMDLVLTNKDKIIAIECKSSTAPKLTRNFWTAVDDIKPTHTFVLAPIKDSYKIKEKVTIINLVDFLNIEW